MTRLRRGTRVVASRAAHWAVADDVTTGRAREAALRTGAVVSTVPVLWHWPAAVLPLAGVGAVAAWLAGAPRAGEDQDDAADDGHEPTREELHRDWHLQMIDAAIGDRTGVHLRDLLAIMRHAPRWSTWELHDVRALLDDLGVPITPKLRLGQTVTVGVRREHVEPLLRWWPLPGLDYPSPDAVTCVDDPVDGPVAAPVDRPENGGGARTGHPGERTLSP